MTCSHQAQSQAIPLSQSSQQSWLTLMLLESGFLRKIYLAPDHQGDLELALECVRFCWLTFVFPKDI